MAEQLRGFVCRLKKTGYLCGFRKADGQPNEWHTWTDRTAAEQHTGELGEILPVVTYIGPDAPMWRQRPTCPGRYVSRFGLAFSASQRNIDRWHSSMWRDDGPFFGPLPEIPQELRT